MELTGAAESGATGRTLTRRGSANVTMPNLTPVHARGSYKLYEGQTWPLPNRRSIQRQSVPHPPWHVVRLKARQQGTAGFAFGVEEAGSRSHRGNP